MRSTLDIIIALKESQPVTAEECRFALLALNAIEHFISDRLNDLIEAIETDKKSVSIKVHFAKECRERMFQAVKKDPQVWLGPDGTPGTPEYEAMHRTAKAVARAAGVL